MTSTLEEIARSVHYDELPETWRIDDIYTFSERKRLYDYQRSALKNAACALFRYYQEKYDWQPSEPEQTDERRKRNFRALYTNAQFSDIVKYDTRSNREKNKQNEVFRILSEYITPDGASIQYHQLINRMCFWMATGSGKTLVMIKLIEYLHFLQQRNEIPNYPILILAPSEHLLKQIRQTVDEFNYARDAAIDLIALRSMQRAHQGLLGDTIPVYYHRSDNISDVQKENRTDYQTYERDGKWFILLDEAHKGTKEDSKRQAYYTVMSRNGFLFNFSATFTDPKDIATTVKKYNLAEFIKEGRSKNIYLNESEYDAFRYRREEVNDTERKKIVLKSLIALAYISMRVEALRDSTGLRNDLYHLPLMLTLVNSVNTDIHRNDLRAFFETLRSIASGEITDELFKTAKEELVSNWENAELLFSTNKQNILDGDEKTIEEMTVAKLRKMVFLSTRKGALQYVRSKDDKELAFQMKNAASPFALIRIGSTAKWRNNLLANYEETTTLQEKSFFDELEKRPITILMGSRSFFESWDSNRPNIINYINIGVGSDAKKFVVQSIGRGVRIQPLPSKRGRLQQVLTKDSNKKANLKRRNYQPSQGEIKLDDNTKAILEKHLDKVLPIETLFIFATNREAIKTVLEGLKTERDSSFELLPGFELEQRPRIKSTRVKMPLLVPEYRAVRSSQQLPKFTMNEQTLNRFKRWFAATSESVFIVRDRWTKPQIDGLEKMITQQSHIEIKPEKHYNQLSFLQSRLLHHIDTEIEETRGVRPIKETEGQQDIVHFRQIRVQEKYLNDLSKKIRQVKAGKTSDEELPALFKKLEKDLINREQLADIIDGEESLEHEGLTIKKIAKHYYLPIILGHKQANFIQHIVKERSEIDFLEKLEEWTAQNDNGRWDAWMFSKIDESLDNIYIPYFNSKVHSYSRFLPDFIFWMCKDNQYQIVFVDPKGTTHTNAYHKIDGYKELFEQSGQPKLFTYKKNQKVSIKLLLFNPEPTASKAYSRYWTNNISTIFD
ncbi:MAG: DEAD/DEAH box helicase family protein [Chromatiales bacterium]|nr:DEAD/DEAH box helicase family protein [Chromatiales bacterium]